jgi:hypothetical protein
MKHSKTAFDAYRSKLRKQKLLKIIETDGISIDSVTLLMEIILKDAISDGTLCDTKQQKIFCDFLKIKSDMEKDVSKFEVSNDTLKDLLKHAKSIKDTPDSSTP